MSDPQAPLKNHQPTRNFLLAIDSDGCAFDTMEVKQKRCFTPNHIKHWNLEVIAEYVREVSEFVNLYSKWRGNNRFLALLKVFELLADRKEVRELNAQLPVTPNFRRWVETESKLGNSALEAYCGEHGREEAPDMHTALAWSKGIDALIVEFVRGVSPFPHVRESILRASEDADILVCSATPHEALCREWEEHGLARYPFTIAGQEQGKKAEQIALASNERYEKDHILMVGDAPGDMRAARANDVLFYPIKPGSEAESWRRFHDEAWGFFLAGEYAGGYENELVAEFEACLPGIPPWEK